MTLIFLKTTSTGQTEVGRATFNGRWTMSGVATKYVRNIPTGHEEEAVKALQAQLDGAYLRLEVIHDAPGRSY